MLEVVDAKNDEASKDPGGKATTPELDWTGTLRDVIVVQTRASLPFFCTRFLKTIFVSVKMNILSFYSYLFIHFHSMLVIQQTLALKQKCSWTIERINFFYYYFSLRIYIYVLHFILCSSFACFSSKPKSRKSDAIPKSCQWKVVRLTIVCDNKK